MRRIALTIVTSCMLIVVAAAPAQAVQHPAPVLVRYVVSNGFSGLYNRMLVRTDGRVFIRDARNGQPTRVVRLKLSAAELRTIKRKLRLVTHSQRLGYVCCDFSAATITTKLGTVSGSTPRLGHYRPLTQALDYYLFLRFEKQGPTTLSGPR